MNGPRRIEPLTTPPDAKVSVPGSKSLTNRALVCGGLAAGRSRLEGALLADDTEAMIECLGRLGAAVTVVEGPGIVEVQGTGGHLRAGPVDLDARLSGTTARFVLPLLAVGEGPYRLDGAEPLRARPMADGIVATRALGARVIEEREPGHLPVSVRRGAARAGSVTVPGATSSQFLSGLLMVGPVLGDGLTIEVEGPLVSEPYAAMTLAVMRAFGAQVISPLPGTHVVGATGYRATTYEIEPDASAASYFFAAAAICGGRVRVEGIGSTSLQGDLGFVDLLARMGAEVSIEPGATEVRGTGHLDGIVADLSGMSDTAQTLGATAVFADGPTEVRGIGFVRHKETDRIAATVAELRRCGIEATETDDGFVVWPGTPSPTLVRTYDDHRMAMAFALLGLRVPGIEIDDPGCVAKTFPGYFDVLDGLRRAQQ